MLFAVEGRFVLSAWLIFFAMVADTVDGALARMTRTSSRFGIELDSLADVVSFGVAPAFVVTLRFHLLEHPYWLFPLFYAACGALRLARFNTTARETILPGDESAYYFRGTPIPAPAAVLLGLILLSDRPGVVIPRPAMVLLLFLLGYLAISNVKYPSSKWLLDPRRPKPFRLVVIVLLTSLLLATYFVETWIFLTLVYYLSGPIGGLLRREETSPEEILPSVVKGREEPQDRRREE